jgi:TolA-binding protein
MGRRGYPCKRCGRRWKSCIPTSADRERNGILSSAAHTLRSTDEVIEQLRAQNQKLQEQLKASQEQRAFDCHEYEGQIAVLIQDLCKARYEIATRNAEAAFAGAPSPSGMVH